MALTRIVYVVSTLERCGPTNQLLNIIKYLPRENYDPVIVTFSPEPRESQIDAFKVIDVEVISLSLSRLEGVITAGRYLRKQVDSIKPNIVHTNGYRADIVSIKSLSQCSLITTLRANLFDNYSDTYGKFVGYAMAYRHMSYLRRMDVVVACSECVAEVARLRGIKQPLTVQNGVDVDVYHPIEIADKILMRNKLNLPNSAKIFISVGALSLRKDPLTIIKGFLQSSRANDSLLIFLGNGPIIDACKDAAKDNPQILFFGMVDNVAEYLKASDFYISASLSEGLPNAVIEALSCGLPVFLSDIPQHMEILKEAGCAGESFPSRCTSALTDSLNSIAFEKYEAMKLSALRLIDKNFSASSMSARYQDVYQSLLS